MSVEFIDTNILVYAHDRSAGQRHDRSVELIARLFENGDGAISIQVLTEFYNASTKKLGMKSEEAEAVIKDLSGWMIHRPATADVLRAVRLHRDHHLSWWDALILNSAKELGCSVLWSEDFSNGHVFDRVTVRNPFT